MSRLAAGLGTAAAGRGSSTARATSPLSVIHRDISGRSGMSGRIDRVAPVRMLAAVHRVDVAGTEDVQARSEHRLEIVLGLRLDARPGLRAGRARAVAAHETEVERRVGDARDAGAGHHVVVRDRARYCASLFAWYHEMPERADDDVDHRQRGLELAGSR